MLTQTDRLFFCVQIVQTDQRVSFQFQHIARKTAAADLRTDPAFQDLFNVRAVIGQTEVKVDRHFFGRFQNAFAYVTAFFLQTIFHSVFSSPSCFFPSIFQGLPQYTEIFLRSKSKAVTKYISFPKRQQKTLL